MLRSLETSHVVYGYVRVVVNCHVIRKLWFLMKRVWCEFSVFALLFYIIQIMTLSQILYASGGSGRQGRYRNCLDYVIWFHEFKSLTLIKTFG